MTNDFSLTLANYYSPDRPHISNSMLSDYSKSRAYYKAKYIDKDPRLQFKVTDSMKRGLVVDDQLTNEGNGGYQMKFKRSCLKRDNPDQYEMETHTIEDQKQLDPRYLVGEKTYEEAEEIIEAIRQHSFWKNGLEKRDFQVLLKGELEDSSICGLADWIDDLGDGRYRIVDLKVTSAMKLASTAKWSINSINMGYVRQGALYQHMFAVDKRIPIENIEFCHAVAAFVMPGVVKIELFRFKQDMLDVAFDGATELLRDIRENHFEDIDKDWGDVVDLKLWTPS